MYPLVIGLSGSSSSGKTTIAKRIRDLFSKTGADGQHRRSASPPCVVFHLDDYYFREGDPRCPPIIPELGMHDWDHPSAFDLDRLVSDVEAFLSSEAVASTRVVIVEGIVIYDCPALVDLLQLRYRLVVDLSTSDSALMRTTNHAGESSVFLLSPQVHSLQT